MSTPEQISLSGAIVNLFMKEQERQISAGVHPQHNIMLLYGKANKYTGWLTEPQARHEAT